MEHQPAEAPTRATVMLLGTAHLANRNRDVFNVQFDDMLAAGRQAEIRDCIDRLKRWNPTKVAMEVSTNRADVLDEEFRRYLAGTFNLTADEIHQLGFRIAAELGHEQLYAIDWNEPIGDGQGLDPVFAFAQAHQPEIYNQLIGGGQRELEQAQASVASTSVREMLCGANDPASLRHSHQPYLVMACVGEGKHYVGIDWVKGWYERNLKIFVNLTRIVASPRDRILVIYGAGHVPLLAQFIRDSGFYTLESVEPYLC